MSANITEEQPNAQPVAATTMHPPQVESCESPQTTQTIDQGAVKPRLPVAQDNQQSDPNLGRVVGRYLVEAVIGVGGMGAVYEAQQLKPVKRKVAIKMIRGEHLSEEAKSRFLAECQALALMDHPDIARIFDVGTEEGQPYFAMEFAHGLPIDKFCRQHRFTVKQRIELVIRVCRAIHHAHLRGVIHRDIKPSNVLVSLEQNQPVVKVIDFGIAKAVDQSLNPNREETQVGQAIGTPNYMSPEQAHGHDVDQRTDVFALGGLLFQLLTDHPPIQLPKDRQSSFAEIIRCVTSYEPITPVEQLQKCSAEERAQVAADRQETFRNLKSGYRGDLTWITLHALNPNKLERYAAASDLADELENYLDHRPIRAGRPSLAHRAKKFVQRHRTQCFVALTLFICLLLFGGLSSAQWFQARQEKAQQIAQFESDIERHLRDARDYLTAAATNNEEWDRELSRAENSLGQAQAIANDLPNGATWLAKSFALGKQIDQFEESAHLVRRLLKARDQGLGQVTMSGYRDVEQSASALKSEFAAIGLQVPKTKPSAAIDRLRAVPNIFHEDLISSLDFWLNETSQGIGIELEAEEGKLNVSHIQPNSPATNRQPLNTGHQILAIDNGAGFEPVSANQLTHAQRLLAGPPDSSVRVKFQAELHGEYIITFQRGGHDAWWLIQVLKDLDPNPFRTQLRQAIFNADYEALITLANEANVEEQPPFTIIQLARKLPAPVRGTIGLDLLKQVRHANPSNYWANQYLGMAYFSDIEQANYEESARYFTAAASLNPDSMSAHRWLGNILLSKRKFGPALEALNKAMQLSPDYEHLRFELARLHHHLSNWDPKHLPKAIEHYQEHIARHDDDAEIYAYLGDIHGGNGDYVQQIAAYRAGLADDPNSLSTRYKLAGTLWRNGDKEAAAQEFAACAASRNLDFETYGMIMGSHPPEDRGKYSPALLRERLAATDDPAQRHKLHGYYFLQIADWPVAAAALLRSQSLDPHDLETTLFLQELAEWHTIPAWP